MKQMIRRTFPLFLSLILALSAGTAALASGDGNMDGGGGGMGSGTATDVWHNQDGVRITVVTEDGSPASTPFDLSNFGISGDILHFGKISKLQYSGGAPLSLDSHPYSCSRPGTALPRIISGGRSGTRAAMEAIRRYFYSEYAAQLVADKTGIPFEELVSGTYKLAIEPVAYFTHGGLNYAMTATEAALYNQMSDGALRRTMPSLTHQNLPLALFLETPDRGSPAWTGTTSGKVSNAEILSALGIGIVSYRDVPEEMLQAPDYTYRVDTDVITSVTLTSSTEVNPDRPASVTFHINGGSYTVNDIVMPAGGSQVVWAKWHTPPEPTMLTIQVSVSGASTARTSFVARIVSLEENLPPDPLATDTNPHFSMPSLPSNPRRPPRPGASGAPGGTSTGNGRQTGSGKATCSGRTGGTMKTARRTVGRTMGAGWTGAAGQTTGNGWTTAGPTSPPPPTTPPCPAPWRSTRTISFPQRRAIP